MPGRHWHVKYSHTQVHTLVDMLCHTDFEGHVHRHAGKSPERKNGVECNKVTYTLPVASTVTSLIFTSTRHPISFPEHFHKKTTSTKNNKA